MKTYDIVKQVLTEVPFARDNDYTLLWEVWKRIGAVSFFGHLNYDRFSKTISPETITRARRIIQKKYPNLQSTLIVRLRRQSRASKKGTFIYQ